jgi:hypothetical protein
MTLSSFTLPAQERRFVPAPYRTEIEKLKKMLAVATRFNRVVIMYSLAVSIFITQIHAYIIARRPFKKQRR